MMLYLLCYPSLFFLSTFYANTKKLKEAAKNSIGFPSKAEAIEMKHLIDMIELINEQIKEVDKKIEEFSVQNKRM